MNKPLHIPEDVCLVDTYYSIAGDRFHYLKFIIEGYDNLAVISSVRDQPNCIRLKCAAESLEELVTLLSSLAPHIKRATLL
ncbi:MAG: DUF4911 domain-containing protein [Desulfofustis sp.]|nr:DUF4911 domain-containing protein [Desulfofustis sp.]